MTTERQEASNRKNAKRSSGPKSDPGKERSARNSLRHGGYSAPKAITRGPWREDEEHVASDQAAIIRGLHPQDECQRRHAQVIAEQYIRVSRLAQFEAALLASESEASRSL